MKKIMMVLVMAILVFIGVEGTKEVSTVNVQGINQEFNECYTYGIVTLDNGNEIDLDYLNKNKNEDCFQVYYDKNKNGIIWVYNKADVVTDVRELF